MSCSMSKEKNRFSKGLALGLFIAFSISIILGVLDTWEERVERMRSYATDITSDVPTIDELCNP